MTYGDLWAEWMPALAAFVFVLIALEFALTWMRDAAAEAGESL